MPEELDFPEKESIPLGAEPKGEDEEPISLVRSSEEKPSSARAFGADAAKAGKEKVFKRPLNITGRGATRVRLFHSKIAVTSLEHLERQINDWLDSEEIEVKHVGHTIGTMTGKAPEPNLLVTIWY